MSQNQSGRRMPTPAAATAPATSDNTPAVTAPASDNTPAQPPLTSVSPVALAVPAVTPNQWAAAGAQRATSGLSEVLSLQHATFDADELVEMRVLVDHDGYACNAVIVLPAGEARAAEDARWGDTHPAAIAAARA